MTIGYITNIIVLILKNIGDFMYEKVLKNIRYYFMKTGISIEELSNQTNLSSAYLKSLIKGARKNPSLDTIYKLAVAFNVNIIDLIGIK